MLLFLISSIIPFPNIPKSYTIKGTWKVPYTNLSNPIIIVVEPGRQYYSQLDGLEQVWSSSLTDRTYKKIVVAQDHIKCYSAQANSGDYIKFLPTADDGFEVLDGGNFSYSYHGKACQLWEKKIVDGKTLSYKLYIDENGSPVAYVLYAISMFNSHYDNYVLEVDEFYRYALPGFWNFPHVCDSSSMDEIPESGFSQVFPFDFSSKSFADNMKKVRREKGSGLTRHIHIDNTGFKSHFEKQKLVRRNLVKRKNALNDDQKCTLYKYTGKELPDVFSWRNHTTKVVGDPRDQVACGSCWAFSTAEVLESAFAIKSSEFRYVSSNQIMDCTWDRGNNGCQGGLVDQALLSYMNKSVKITSEDNYPYIGVSGYCDLNRSDVIGRVTKCYSIEKSTKAVKEALMTKGPLSIAINVIEPMMLYTGGVIDDERCTGTEDDLIHAVLLTGWTIIDGKEAWEVKNSWSTFWGDNGYMYIQSGNQERNCGVTTDAVAVDVELID